MKTGSTIHVIQMRLNTKYDLNSGTLSIDPGRTVKWRYYGTRSSTESFWLGMEDSAAIYKGYIFMTDNGGNLMCLDLNRVGRCDNIPALIHGIGFNRLCPFLIFRGNPFLLPAVHDGIRKHIAYPLYAILPDNALRRSLW